MTLELNEHYKICLILFDECCRFLILILKKLYDGQIALSRHIFDSLKSKKAFLTLQNYFFENGDKDKSSHRPILIKSVGILKQLLDPLW